ncbi:MAG: Flp family type IVb pilin [Armatimonadota bacterium]|jgi:Flp pilus assembly pilin Flp
MMRALWRDEDGTATVEYALLLTVVVLATLAAWGSLGRAVGNAVTASVDTISAGQN